MKESEITGFSLPTKHAESSNYYTAHLHPVEFRNGLRHTNNKYLSRNGIMNRRPRRNLPEIMTYIVYFPCFSPGTIHEFVRPTPHSMGMKKTFLVARARFPLRIHAMKYVCVFSPHAIRLHHDLAAVCHGRSHSKTAWIFGAKRHTVRYIRNNNHLIARGVVRCGNRTVNYS